MFLKLKDFPIICKEYYTSYTSMLHVEMIKQV